jgi:hypothetical protein
VTPNVAAATAFFSAMKNKDLSQAPLAENVSYDGPLSGEVIRGRNHVSRFLAVYLPVIIDVSLIRQISEGDSVATVWRAETSFGPISLVYIFRLDAGKIVEIEAFYDPRGSSTEWECGPALKFKVARDSGPIRAPIGYTKLNPRMSSQRPSALRRFLLAAKPEGLPKESDFNLVEAPLPALQPGQVLVKTV